MIFACPCRTSHSPKRRRLRRLQNFQLVPAAAKSKAAPTRDDPSTPKRALPFQDSPVSNSSKASTLILPGRGEEAPTVARPENDNVEGGQKLADNTKDKENQITVTEQDKPGASKVLDEKQKSDTMQPLDTVKTEEKLVEKKENESMVPKEKPIPDTTENKHMGIDKKPARGRVTRPKASAKSASSKARKKPASRVVKKKQTKEEKKRVHRAACDRWHAKWLRKGVLRSEAEGSKAVESKRGRKKGQDKNTGKDNQKPEVKSAHKSTTSETVENDKTQKIQSNQVTENKKGKSLLDSHPKEIHDALTQDGMANLTLTSNDLRTTKAAWVKKYISILTERESAEVAAGQAKQLSTSAEKYKEAVAAWMTSYLRGVLNSGKDKGFASIPASMLAV